MTTAPKQNQQEHRSAAFEGKLRILEALHPDHCLGQTELAVRTGVTKGAVSKWVKDLLKHKLIKEDGLRTKTYKLEKKGADCYRWETSKKARQNDTVSA